MTEHLTSPNAHPASEAPTPVARLEQAERRLRGMQEISRVIANESDLTSALDAILHQTTDLMQCEHACYFHVDHERGVLTTEGIPTSGQDGGLLELPLEGSIPGAAALEGRPLNIKDASRDPRHDQTFDRATGFTTRSILCVPFHERSGLVTGVFQVINSEGGYFAPDDATMLSAIGSQAAVIVRKQHLHYAIARHDLDLRSTTRALQARQAEIELLLEIERAAAIARSLDEALPGILSATVSRYPVGVAAVFLTNPTETAVELHAHAGAWSRNIAPRDRLALTRDVPWIDAVLSGRPRPQGEALKRAVLATCFGACLEPPRDGYDVWDFPIQRGNDPVLGVLLIIDCPKTRELDPFPLDLREAASAEIEPHHGMEQARRILEGVADRVAVATTFARAIDEERKAERLAAIGTALSGVVHDMRTPLTVISGYARSMEREPSQERRAAHRGIIKRQIEQIQAMIGEVLDFASGRSAVLLRRVFVRELLAELEILFNEELASLGILFTMDATYKGAVRADQRRVVRVFANVIKNAREALEIHPPADGGQPAIRLSVEAEGERVYFRFRDNGPGLPDELAGRLFESFTTHGKGQGTGLGLAMAQKTVQEHGGTLEAVTLPEGGALITIGLSPA